MGKFDEEETPAPPPVTWQKWGLQLTEKQTPYLNLHNAAIILESDPGYKGTVYYDEFLQRIMRRNSPAREWHDADDLELTRHIQYVLGIPRMGREAVSQAVLAVAHKHPRNCVKEWLETLMWDGTPRINEFFSDHFGAPENEYVQAAGKNFWLSLIARIHRPGCKVDNMIVLEGEQGLGKSTALQIIGGAWFAEQHESATNPKSFAEILQGKWLVEISEMDSFTRAEVNRVKQTVSCPSDRFRASYGRHAVDHPRTCVFVGTTNKDDWNRDETGARRFWPIACSGPIGLQGIRAARNQYFAEALVRFKDDETHWEMPLELTQREQDARYQADPWQPIIDNLIKGEAFITTSQILDKLDRPMSQRTKTDEMRVGSCLRYRRWLRGMRRIDGIPTRGYTNPAIVTTKAVTAGEGSNAKSPFD